MRITLYGKLEDKFGDNGVVSVVIGTKKDGNKSHTSASRIFDVWELFHKYMCGRKEIFAESAKCGTNGKVFKTSILIFSVILL